MKTFMHNRFVSFLFVYLIHKQQMGKENQSLYKPVVTYELLTVQLRRLT